MPPVSRWRAEEDSPPRATAPALIVAGRAFVGGRLEPMEVAIDDTGRIQSLGKIRTGAPRHDVGDSVILPAATDLHVHFREPGGTNRSETIAGGTLQAALGGVTLVADMPNNQPPISDVGRLEEKMGLVIGRAAIDVLLYASPLRFGNLGQLARKAGAFKVYLSPTTGITEVPRSDELPLLWNRLAELGLAVSVHAEDPDLIRSDLVARTPAEWNVCRPVASEKAALDRLENVPSRLRLHVAHVTTATGVSHLESLGHSFEVTPHHLLLSERSGGDARFKVNPPLRSEDDRRNLWEAFRAGRVPIVASDHAPHAREAKELAFDKAPSGTPGVETMLPLLLARVRAGELDLATLVAAACDRPARWLGQPLGRIAPGHRANLLVVDFKAQTRLAARHLHARCGWTPFEGWEAIFPREHYRDGERIVEGGEHVGGTVGRVVRPEYAPRPDPMKAR